MNPCPVRDPEDGSCYRTADEADLAWITRGNQAPQSRHVALPPGLPAILAAAREQADDLPLEEDPDGDEPMEDGLYSRGSVVPAVLPSLSDEQKSFWQNLGRTLKGLVVSKKDSRPASIPEEELATLFATDFPLPIESFPKEKLRDTFDASRGRHRKHHAIDLGAPKGTPIVAVNDGTIERLGRDRRGGIVIYLRDATGRFVYYYAHLSRYAPGLKVGDRVARGQKIGEVGSTGRSTGPHLHFSIFRDTDSPSPWKGLVVNPYLVFSALIGPK
ncbi:MAG: M23 family metallopeptidase [Holophagales bacterium]|nr:M23 family metallopeptidase [Holophagales bacterium]